MGVDSASYQVDMPARSRLWRSATVPVAWARNDSYVNCSISESYDGDFYSLKWAQNFLNLFLYSKKMLIAMFPSQIKGS